VGYRHRPEIEDAPGSYELKGTFSIPEPEEVSGVTFPVIANGRLYLRDNDRLLCYDLRAGASPTTAPFKRTLHLPTLDAKTVDATPPDSHPRIGVNRSPDAIFVPTPNDIVARMIELARPAPTNVLYDLGSGDGRFLIAAARQYGCRGIGLEIDPRLVAMARENVRAEGLDHLIRIEHADIFQADFSEADVVTAYLPSPLLERLLPQLRKLRSGARVVTHQFSIPGLKPSATEQVVSKEDGDAHRIQVWLPSTRPAVPSPTSNTNSPDAASTQ
jgi:SAM-dependent methyltransferase